MAWLQRRIVNFSDLVSDLQQRINYSVRSGKPVYLTKYELFAEIPPNYDRVYLNEYESAILEAGGTELQASIEVARVLISIYDQWISHYKRKLRILRAKIQRRKWR